MSVDLDKLEALALAATPGPWSAERFGVVVVSLPSSPMHNRQVASITGDAAMYDSRDPIGVRDATCVYVSAASPDVILALIAELRDYRAQAEAVIAATGLTEDERVNGDPVKAAKLLSHAFDVFTGQDAARREEFSRSNAIVEAARDWALTWFDRHPHDPPRSEASRALYEAVLGKGES